MSFSLYAAVVPTFQQTLGAMQGLLDKAEAFCSERSLDPADVIQARLAPDMFPFAYQVMSTANHSKGALDGVRKGLYSPELTPPPDSFVQLKAAITDAVNALASVEPAEVDGWVGRDMAFQFRDFRLDFTAENFLLSFSLPNFYFHATTAYDILRWKGAAIGKRDFMGQMRLKR